VTPGGNKPKWRALPSAVADGLRSSPGRFEVFNASVDRPRTNSLEEWK
jgi:hypothetical protein